MMPRAVAERDPGTDILLRPGQGIPPI
jgi:hypothetical protein